MQVVHGERELAVGGEAVVDEAFAGTVVIGSGNLINANGRRVAGFPAGLNKDGLRVTLDSSVFLVDTEISDNGDAGVVVIDSSSVTLRRGSVRGNRGFGARVADKALLQLRGVTVKKNERDDFRVDDTATLLQIAD